MQAALVGIFAKDDDDHVGMDTTGDGKVDAYDTTGDGKADAFDLVSLRAPREEGAPPALEHTVALGTLLYGEKGYYTGARVRASRYGIR